MPNPRQSQRRKQDLAQRIEQLNSLVERLNAEIDKINRDGEIAPSGCWIVRYLSVGKGGRYWYYKWMAGEIPITNDGTFGDSKELLKILEMYLVSLGIEQASEVLLLADGADWIGKNIPPLLESKGCPRSTTYYLQDFYHVTEHLADGSRSGFSVREREAEMVQKSSLLAQKRENPSVAFRDDHAPKTDSLPTPLPTKQGN